MRVVIQRVQQASVEIDQKLFSSIGRGLLVLVGVEDADNEEDVIWISNKLVQIRLFNDADGVMNVSLKDSGGQILVVSQFTLHASTKKGNRPSYIRASKPPHAVPLYERLIAQLQMELDQPVQTGVFGADMQLSLINDGPVTILIDSKNRE